MNGVENASDSDSGTSGGYLMTLPVLYWFCKSVVVAVSAEDFIVDVLGLEGKYFASTFPNSDSSFVRQRNNSVGADIRAK